ncbi:MAG TPA: endonuclease/exonuclease/phosphatase family protein [Candidatus Limnocylindrales bacterium]|nr:endonuclease/exonuclease/phosphatase family protein [Candidatus Limnocylindrales bacterium]
MRVMTWNLWWRFGNWRERQPAILEQLRREEPDLVGLQEVWADNETNQGAWLAKELGMHHVFGASSDQQRWRDRVDDPSAGFGVAILSRWPVRDEQVFDLPQDSSRPLLSVTVDAPHATIPFLTTHLSAMPFGNSARRLAQLEFVARHTATLPVTDHPPVVAGDFNAEPDSDELRRFGGHLTAPFVEGQVFLDAWRYADHHDPGHTWDRANPYVAEWLEPSSRIDYIHVVARSSGPGHIRSARRTSTSAIDGVWPSDHAAVIAELSEF